MKSIWDRGTSAAFSNTVHDCHR